MVDSPNILLIHADQHRGDCLGVMGNPDIITPNIDALATDGVVYEQCYCTFPVCTPSRYSLLTGLYVHQHLGWSNESTLPHGLPTFPRILKEAGYKTKCVGKMHFTPTYLDVGFDEMVLAEQAGNGRYDDDYHRYLKEKGLFDCTDSRDQVSTHRKFADQEYYENFGTEKSNLDEMDYSTTWIGERAIETVNGWSEGGNLLMVGFIKPHHPHDAPSPWADMYNPKELTVLPGWTEELLKADIKFSSGFFDYSKLDKDKLQETMAQYYASITQIDSYVGKLVEILKKKGIYDNTLIIYTSDHGDYLGFHHLLLKSNYMYDPVMHVPLIIKYPDGNNKGKRDNKLVSVIDTMATIVDEASCMIPKELWRSITPLNEADREVVFGETDRNGYMVRSKTRKLLYYKENQSMLFDLQKDPYEMNNLISDPAYAKDVEYLKGKLFDWLCFESRSQIHYDEKALTNQGPNVPKNISEHRKELKEYYDRKIDELQNKLP